MTSRQLVELIARKLTAHDVKKLVPTVTLLKSTYRAMVRCEHIRSYVEDALAEAEEEAEAIVIPATIKDQVETLLKKEGCDVVTATDGFEALAKISDQQPNIIFVDIMMPRLDGYQTCALIKNNQMFKGTPVIMLSSKDGLFDKARGRIVGSEQYLTKPFTREELLGAIRRHVSHK